MTSKRLFRHILKNYFNIQKKSILVKTESLCKQDNARMNAPYCNEQRDKNFYVSFIFNYILSSSGISGSGAIVRKLTVLETLVNGIGCDVFRIPYRKEGVRLGKVYIPGTTLSCIFAAFLSLLHCLLRLFCS